MGAPNTKDWHAYRNEMPGGPSAFYVIGQVETNAGNMVPVLRETVPQGINPDILLLTLTIEQDGDFGTADVAYRPARYDGASGSSYSRVTIMHEGSPIADMPVEVVS